MYVGSDHLQSVLLARRLVLLTRQAEKNRENSNNESSSFKEILERDGIELSSGLEGKESISKLEDDADKKMGEQQGGYLDQKKNPGSETLRLDKLA